jgi:exopolyphosphatase / guanosine-5'-triphosphate,3'-diphosphate pyrophosphatase
MRVATIDIGTNTVLLLVADQSKDGSLVAVAERATITRLGKGVDRSRRLAPAAIARTKLCLDEYADMVNALGVSRTAVVATSAMRDASGGEQLREQVRARFGVDARVLSGDEEARLTFRGAVGGLDLTAQHQVAVFDIGGGSTEVVIADPSGALEQLTFTSSFDVGSVRLTERHVAHDPPTPGERDALLGAARRAFSAVPQLETGTVPIGIAGTMTTLAAVSLGLSVYDAARIHRHSMARDEIWRVMDLLGSMNLESRRGVPGLDPGRADVIVAGAFIALALLDHWSASSVTISDRGVRWGLAEELSGGLNLAYGP